METPINPGTILPHGAGRLPGVFGADTDSALDIHSKLSTM
jgi:hypothetical protein